MNTNENGYEHPTGMTSAPVAMYRDGIRASAVRLSDAVRALEAHPCWGLTRGAVTGERTESGWIVEALFGAPRAGLPTETGRAATCWQGHEVELVDGRGRCHCGESIAQFEPEVE
jgi:hypothetical protein